MLNQRLMHMNGPWAQLMGCRFAGKARQNFRSEGRVRGVVRYRRREELSGDGGERCVEARREGPGVSASARHRSSPRRRRRSTPRCGCTHASVVVADVVYGPGRRSLSPELKIGSVVFPSLTGGGFYTPPVGGAGTRGRVPRVRGCLVGPRPIRLLFLFFLFLFFQISNKIRNINNF
jgi:hypothetical protein